jgi:hypothetical protein
MKVIGKMAVFTQVVLMKKVVNQTIGVMLLIKKIIEYTVQFYSKYLD